jgi:UDP-N-acetylbacillosamine N-acetyltransferase
VSAERAAFRASSASGDLFIALQDAQAKARLSAECAPALVNLIHPSTVVSPSAVLSRNIFVGAFAFVNMDARVADGVVVNSRAAIEHDNEIGECVFLGTGATLSGHVHIGSFTMVGAGVTIKPGTRVAGGVTLGAGAVVVRDVTEPGVYVGNPAELLGAGR